MGENYYVFEVYKNLGLQKLFRRFRSMNLLGIIVKSISSGYLLVLALKNRFID
jgi:hypothetical protein